MANAREIKSRISSVQDTMKITNAMYMISSSKMKKAKKILSDTEPYFYNMQSAIARILRHIPDIQHPFFSVRHLIPTEERKIATIVVTGDKGMAGAYNHNITKMTEEFMANTPGHHKLYVLGVVGRQYFSKKDVDMDGSFRYTVQKPTMHRARMISEEVIRGFLEREVDEVHIIYTQMQNAVVMEPVNMQLLPLKKTNFSPLEVPVGVHQEEIEMFDKLEDLLIRLEEILSELQEPDVASDPNRFRKLMKEQSELTPIVEAYKEYKACKQNIEESLELLNEESDEDMRELAKEELNESKARVEELEHELKILLLPKDPNDDKNIILEIRAGAGGDEAALFAAELYRMYSNYADSQHWKVEIISINENGIGGFKEVVAMVTGKGAYSKLKYESGVHRVQRVPETESGGRIHTSTATVAVMPEAEEVDVQIDMNDCRIDVMRASGNGGQCVNTTDSAVRLTHMPTGIVIYSQTEKSQLQNKEKAFRLLRSKLYDLELEKRQNSEAEERRSQIGTGDRSEKIRTYNFPQGRVTDHRIKLTLYKIDSIMNGDIQELLDNLIAADQAAKLAKMNEN